MSIGDKVMLEGTIITISASGNPIVEFKSGIRMLVKQTDIVTNVEKENKDEREDN